MSNIIAHVSSFQLDIINEALRTVDQPCLKSQLCRGDLYETILTREIAEGVIQALYTVYDIEEAQFDGTEEDEAWALQEMLRDILNQKDRNPAIIHGLY